LCSKRKERAPSDRNKKKLQIGMKAHGWFWGKLAWSVGVAEIKENKL
jgi:hypothetical protein